MDVAVDVAFDLYLSVKQMIIAGLEKMSLLDYPGKVSAIVFTYGCDMRCPYCHNPELVTEKLVQSSVVGEDEVLEFLKRRVGKLDALVITGGEPTIYKDLEDFIVSVKELGFLVKLDSNGGNPNRLEAIMDREIVDYWAMDVKYSGDLYEQGIDGGRKISSEDVASSIRFIMDKAPDYEFRTTVMKGMHDEDAMHEIGKMVKGAKVFYLQNFRAGKTIDSQLSDRNSFSEVELMAFKTIMEEYVKDVVVR